MPPKSPKKPKSGKGEYREYGADNLRIRHPNFSYSNPIKQAELGIISKSIEGKWVGTSVVHECTYEEKTFVPYNPEINYGDLFSSFGYEGMGNDYDVISSRTLKKWDWFGNKCIIAFDSSNVYEHSLEIEEVNGAELKLNSRVHFKNLNIDNFYSKYEKNHKVMNRFQNESLEKQEEIDRRLQGTEHAGEECLLHQVNGFYVPANEDHLNLKIGVKDYLGVIPSSPEKDCYTMILEQKEGLAIQQISDDSIIMHSSSYSVIDLIRPELINVRTFRATKQHKTEFKRIRQKPTTNINVSGDYVAKKVEIRDSVINRSEI